MRPFSARSALLLAFVAAIALGCADTKGPTGASAVSLAVETLEPTASPWEPLAAQAQSDGLELLEVSEDGRAFAGRRLPAPPRSSARLMFEPFVLDASGPARRLASARRIQDARFAPAPSRAWALLDDRDVLWVSLDGSETVRRVDEQVFPGFAFSHSAALLAYSRGLAPELDGWTWDSATGARTRLTDSGAAVWGFAFSPDDSRIAYVGSREGFPCLLVVSRDGSSPAKLTNRGLPPERLRAGAALAPFPDGRRPPIWAASSLYVEDAAGVHAIDQQGRVILGIAGATDLHRGSARGTVLWHEGARLRGVR
jgi:hypothetical protein